MEINEILEIVTFFVALGLGILAKKVKFIDNKLIPIQNICVGIIMAIIEWVITKDFNTAIALSGILAGGSYDIIHNIDKLRQKNKEEKEIKE